MRRLLNVARWNEIRNRYNSGLVRDLVANAIETGRIPL